MPDPYFDPPDEWFIRRGRRPRAEQIAHERAAAARRRSERVNRSAVLQRDGNRCRYCGAVGLPLAVDHVMPFSRGGSSEMSNLAAACKSCNSRKKDRTPEEAGMVLRPIPEPEITDAV